MINKLYNLKKLQTNQQVLQKQQLLASIASIDEEIEDTHRSISTATVQTIGAINDFKVLEIHKNTMRNHIVKLHQKRSHFAKEVENRNKAILELNKETEQFKYIKDEQKKQMIKKQIKNEDNAAAEYMQAKWMVS